MALALQDFFQFIAANTPLLEEIYERGEVTEGELAHLISQFRKNNSPSDASVRRQLLDLDILEPTAHSHTSFEMVGYLRDLFDQLLKQPQMYGAPVLEGFLEELSDAVAALTGLNAGDNPWAVRRLLYSVERVAEKIRRLGRMNQDGVATECQQLRTTKEPMSSSQRFGVVRHIWDKYLIALRSIIDTKGRLETKVKALLSTLLHVEEAVDTNLVLRPSFSKVRARIARMQESVFQAHHSSVQEILPLYERLRRESRLAQAAAQALILARVRGVEALNIDSRLAVSGSRSRHVFSTDRLQKRLAELLNFQQRQDTVDIGPTAGRPPTPRYFIPLVEVKRALREASNGVEDILDFVLSNWPKAPLSETLRIYTLLRSGQLGPVTLASSEVKTYLTPGYKLSAWPTRIAGEAE